nr:unnamed protein product [Callosobruchus chinensis]CAH7733089.1 unnamed protein product [Callosobruchus chinensis]
MIMCYF